MPFFRKKDKTTANDRVLDLKARVDALRAADEATRKKAYSLEHFLEGDDVLTSRSVEDDYKPEGFDANAPYRKPEPAPEERYEVNLQAELDKYIQRQEEQERPAPAAGAETTPVHSEPGPAPRPFDTGWDRGGDPLRSTEELVAGLTAGWLGEETAWDATGPAEDETSDAAPSVDPRPAWPPASQWPAEDDWPSDQKAV